MSAAASARSAASPVEGGAQAARNADVRVSSGSGRTGERHRGRPGVLAVLVGQPLRRAVGQESGVHLAVMTDRHRPLPEMDHLDAVRLAARVLPLVVVVPAVGCSRGTGSHLGRCVTRVSLLVIRASPRVARMLPPRGQVSWRVSVVLLVVAVILHPVRHSFLTPAPHRCQRHLPPRASLRHPSAGGSASTNPQL